jgi:hypothetical protein
MSEFARDVDLDASTGLASLVRRRRVGKLPLWLRLVVVLSATASLWAGIIFGLHMLFAG